MAFHKLSLIGRLVSDPRFNSFANGGGVAHLGLPVNFTRPKKNPTTGEWEGESFIINVDVFNKETYKLADLVMQYLKKGSQVYIEGRLRMNEYTDKTGTKVKTSVLVADVVEFLDGRGDGTGMSGQTGMGMGGASSAPRRAATPAMAPPSAGNGSGYDDGAPEMDSSTRGGSSGTDDDIPF
jgi:single-strand DNA-binding protein